MSPKFLKVYMSWLYEIPVGLFVAYSLGTGIVHTGSYFETGDLMNKSGCRSSSLQVTQ